MPFTIIRLAGLFPRPPRIADLRRRSKRATQWNARRLRILAAIQRHACLEFAAQEHFFNSTSQRPRILSTNDCMS